MKLFGSIKELVAAVFRKDSFELTLRPNQSTTLTAARDVQLPPGDLDHALVSATSSQTLTNKTIDGDDNTLQDVALTSLKTEAGDANEVLVRDGSGVVVSAALVNANVDAAAGIDYSKLDLADSIVNADIASGAAILFSKMATLNNTEVVVTSGSGEITTSPITVTELGALDNVSSNIQDQLNARLEDFTSSSDNRLVRTDGTSGTAVQESTVSLNDTGDISNVTDIDLSTVTATEISTPSTPSAAKRRIYAKTDGWYDLDDTGLETKLGSGSGSGSGELNLIVDGSSSSTGWSANVGGFTSSTNTTPANLPLEDLIATSFYIRAGSSGGSGNSIYYRFSNPDSLRNTKLKIEWYQKARSTYESGDIRLELWTNTTSDYLGTYAEVPLSTDASGDTLLPKLDGKFTTTFDASGLEFYELRMVKNNADAGGATDGLDLSNIIVGPGIQPQGAVVTGWESYTPTLTGFGTPSSVQFRHRRVGSALEVQGKFTSGTSTAVEARVAFPSGLTVDSSVLPSLTKVGDCVTNEASSSFNKHITSEPSVSYFTFTSQGNATNGLTKANGSSFISSGSIVSFYATVPIAEWAGSGTVNLAQNDVEYVYNTGTWNSTNATSFAYGPGGATISGSLTTTQVKTVRFSSPIQSTDELILEVSDDQVVWMPISTANLAGALVIPSLNSVATAVSGGWIQKVVGTPTDLKVYFGQYQNVANDDSPVQNWTTGYWRVVKKKAGAAIGFGLATTEQAGLVKSTKYQKKSLGSDFSTTGNMTGVQFNNLEIGKIYRYTGTLTAISAATTGDKHFIADVSHNSVSLVRIRTRTGGGAVTLIANSMSWDEIFVATATTISVNAVTNSNITIVGADSVVKLEELSSHSVTTSWI